MELLNLTLFVFAFGLSWYAAASARVTSAWMMFVVPGTIAHELAHYLVALLTFGRPAPISLFPERTPDGWIMGSVTFVPNFFNGGLVALAPLYLLPPLAWLCWHYHLETGPLQALVLGYLGAVVLRSAWPSSADWSIAWRYPGLMLVLFLMAVAAWNDPAALRALCPDSLAGYGVC